MVRVDTTYKKTYNFCFNLIILLSAVFLLAVYSDTIQVSATEQNQTVSRNLHGSATDSLINEIDYDNIQESIDNTESADSIDFKATVDEMLREGDISVRSITGGIFGNIKTGIGEALGVLSGMLSLVIILALFKNISSTFRNGQVSEAGFYGAYIVLFGNIGITIFSICRLAEKTIASIVDFMKVLIPSYSLTVAVSSGAGTSAVLYEGVLILITICEVIMLKITIPMIIIYILVMLASKINNENTLSKLGELILTAVNWIYKGIIGLVLGAGTVKGLLTPAIDRVRRSSIIKLTSIIPGIGNALSGAAETVLGAASLARNAVGIAGIIVIVVICLIPLLKTLIYILSYKLGAALIQPISDNRVIECLNAASEATMLLFKAMSSCMLMFVLTIAIVAAAA